MKKSLMVLLVLAVALGGVFASLPQNDSMELVTTVGSSDKCGFTATDPTSSFVYTSADPTDLASYTISNTADTNYTFYVWAKTNHVGAVKLSVAETNGQLESDNTSDTIPYVLKFGSTTLSTTAVDVYSETSSDTTDKARAASEALVLTVDVDDILAVAVGTYKDTLTLTLATV